MKTLHKYVEQAKELRPNGTKQERQFCLTLLYLQNIATNLLN